MEYTIALKLVLAAALGGCIGIERQMREKPAGLRTNMLVCVGSALFVIISIQLALASNADQTRIAAQIVTGIGFLGAGAVLHSRGLVVGLTTAATIWVVAGVGMAVGSGFYSTAIIATVLSIATLTLMSYVEEKLHGHQMHGYMLTVSNLGNALQAINETLRKLSIPAATLNFKKDPLHARVWFNLAIARPTHLKLIEQLSHIGEVIQVEAGMLGREFSITRPYFADGDTHE